MTLTLFKINLLVYLFTFVGLVFAWRTYSVYKSTGINPMKLESGDSAQGFNALIFKLLFVAQFINCFIFAFAASYYHWLSPIIYLENSNITLIGIILTWGSLIWILIAQYQMSDSWRIGFDFEEKTALKTHGLFIISRNPIFLGILIADLGFLLLLPNALTLCTVIGSYISIETQVRLEEEYLLIKHKEAYKEYKSKVRRWI